MFLHWRCLARRHSIRAGCAGAQDSLQRGVVILREGEDGGVALFGLLCQRFEEDAVQFWWQAGIQLAGRCWTGMVMMMEQLAGRTLEHRSSRDKLVDHDCQRVLVGGWPHMHRGRQGRVIELFGGHVQGRANRAMQRAPIAIEGCQAKIGQQEMWPSMWEDSVEIGIGRVSEDAALDSYQKVGRLNIAMNNTMIVRALQTRSRLQQVVTRLLRRDGPVKTELLRAFLQPVP